MATLVSEFKTKDHLLAALVSDQVPLNQIPDAYWPEIVSSALEHNLGSVLAAKISGTRHELCSLDQAFRATEVRSKAQNAARCQINSLLRAAGIPTVWLKGSGLAYTVYDAPEQRPIDTLNVLVPSDRFEQACALLRFNGYHYPTEAKSTPEFAAEREYSLILKQERASDVTLELHWHLLNAMLLSETDVDWFWKQTFIIEANGQSITTLQPEAHLLYLCADVLLECSKSVSPLVRFFDLHLLVMRYTLRKRLMKALTWSRDTRLIGRPSLSAPHNSSGDTLSSVL